VSKEAIRSAEADVPRPRGKPGPKGMPKAERRAQILSAAVEIVLERGVVGLTMSALAELTGASKPVIYEHFKNSEEVAAALVREHSHDVFEFIFEHLGKARTIYEYFDILIDKLFEYYTINRSPIRRITNGFSSTREVNAYFLDREKRIMAVYQDLFEQQGIPPRRSRIPCYAIMVSIHETVAQFADQKDPADKESLKQVIAAILRGLLPYPGARPRIPDTLMTFAKKR
jgi:AcrR family transcriptional regulator